MFPIVPLIASILISVPHVEPEAKKAPKEVQGAWVAVKGELGGKPLPEAFFKVINLTIDGETYIVQAESPDKGDLKFGEVDSLKSMDIIGKEGPNKGKTFLAIYKIQDENLVIVYDMEGKTRPTKFETVKGKNQLMLTYKKKKD